ncbi:hypothetical protein, partial [Salmonella sp. s58408]|uniref:hypothetical protein n=1 Tax=Salmonella sp. s58408 TaxID=3159701 RepID=UPI00397FEE2B
MEWDEWSSSFCSIGEVLNLVVPASPCWSFGKSLWSFRQVFLVVRKTFWSFGEVLFLVSWPKVGGGDFPPWVDAWMLAPSTRANDALRRRNSKSGSGRGATLVSLGRRRFFGVAVTTAVSTICARGHLLAVLWIRWCLLFRRAAGLVWWCKGRNLDVANAFWESPTRTG